MAHSKRNTSLAFFTSHERGLLKSTWGSQSTRLSRDSFLPFASCQLCLEIARDPVSCSSNGDIFCRECAVNNLLTQRQEIKRLEKEEERRRKEELELEMERTEEEKERAIVEFEMVMSGLEGGAKKKIGELVVEKEAELERKDRCSKRKFELDEEEMLKNSRAERAKARKVLDEEKSSKPTLPSFWVPSLTPSSKPTHSTPKAPKLTSLCPTSSSSISHPLSLKSLVSINFTTSDTLSSNTDPSTPICPACKKGLSNTLKAMLTIPCGHVLCKPCAGKFMSPPKGPPDPHDPEQDIHIKCYVCDADPSGKPPVSTQHGKEKGTAGKDIVGPRLVQINSEGTGFAGGGKNMAKREGVAFQC